MVLISETIIHLELYPKLYMYG